MPGRGLLERLSDGGTIICAEGYVQELERRGYLVSGGFIPEVVLDNPDVVRQLHQEFVNAGSDVVEALTYYAHRKKLRDIGREDDLERLNRNALRLAREVAEASGSLLAGGICDTGLYHHDDLSNVDEIKDIFKEQVEWAVEEGVDYIIGETFKTFGEAKLALETIQQYGKGVPAVITISAYVPDVTFDGVPLPDACLELEKCGAAVVGLNCARGPATMLPLIKQIKRVCQGPVAALPIVYRTSDTQRTWHSLSDPDTGGFCFPLDVQCYQCKRSDIRDFAEQAKAAGVQYIGLCCGNASHYTNLIACII